MGELFQLVLVDDKKDIVQGIASSVDWEARGVAVSCFYNGRDALAHIMEHRPDMVITDIRMPFLDGLELAKEVARIYPDVRIIILTGYDDFSYARDALRLGVVEYLSKPVRLQAIEEVVAKGMELSHKKKKEEMDQAAARRQYKKGLPSLQSRWLEGFIRGSREEGEEELKAKFRELEIPLRTDCFIAAVVELDLGEQDTNPETEEELGLMQYAVENMGKELLSETYPCETFRRGSRQVVFLMNYDPDQNLIVSQYEVYSLFSRLQKMMKEYFQTTVSVGIGGRHPLAEGIRVSYGQAMDALEQKFYLGRNSIISVYDMPKEIKEDLSTYPAHLQEELVTAVRRGSLEDGLAVLDEYFHAIKEMKYIRPSVLKDKMMYFLLKLCHECETGEEIRIVDILSEFEKRKTLEGIQEWMSGFITYLVSQIKNQDMSVIRRNILKVKDFIDENYAESISLKKMSDYIYISQSYLSFSFKAIVGVNFNDYVTKVRMERAKELLPSPGYKVYEVCEMVGYRDKKYFSDLFKKYTGMLPKEWSRRENG